MKPNINRNNLLTAILCSVALFMFTCVCSQGLNKNTSLLSAGKEKEPVSEAENYPVFQSLPAGFEYNSIGSILMDYKGYMWFGTSDGLVRFDGINIDIYEHNPDDSTSIIHNNINDIAEDAHHNLWIGTSNGLSLYNREKDNFIPVGTLNEKLNQLNAYYISELCVDKNSMLWIGTLGYGVYVYDPVRKFLEHYSYIDNEVNPISSNRIYCLVVDNENNIWIGTQNGVTLLAGNGGGFTHFISKENDPHSLSNNNITALAADQQGNLWIGTRGGGLNKLSKQNNNYVFEHYYHDSRPGSLSNNTILSINADYNGYIWVGTENGGLNKLDEKTGYFEVYQVEEGNPYSLKSNSIWSLYNDYQGRLWIGTANRGINVMDEEYNKFNSYRRNVFADNSLSENDVKGFAEDSQGGVWIATDGGGLCRFEPKSGKVTRTIMNSDQHTNLANNAVQAIRIDSQKRFWVGTWAGGVDLLNKQGNRIRNYKLENEQGGGDNNVLLLYIDSKENIWAGTAGCGLFRYNKSRDEFDQVVCGNSSTILDPSSFVNSILEDAEGNYWIGTLNGLVHINDANKNNYECSDIIYSNRKGSISSNKIMVIFEDGHQRLWIGTSDNGLNLLHRESNEFTVFQKKDGLPSNSIRGILEDNRGYLWITTNKGLSRFHPDSADFVNYTIEDGLNSNEFNVNACLRSRQGAFYLGGENGFNVFYPENIKRNRFIPPVYLTGLKIGNLRAEIDAANSPLTKHISETDKIILNHKQSSFSIDFVALNYTRSSRNQFLYKLEGFDEDWIAAGNNRSASYTNMKPGRYLFMVKGSNNDGILNEIPAKLEIVIKQPYWKTWWAKLLYVIILSSIVFLYITIRNERIAIREKLKLEQLCREKEHENNEANIQFFTNISHEFRTPLSLIIAPLESLILSTHSKAKEQLMIIYHNAQRLLHLTNDLMDFRKLEEGRNNLLVKHGEIISFVRDVSSYFKVSFKRRRIKLSIHSNHTAIPGWFDPKKLETIILNLLSNAAKYTPDGGTINIDLTISSFDEVSEKYQITHDAGRPVSRYLEIAVTDNGQGIDPDHLPFIFEKFYQPGSIREKTKSGTGIGLALTKGLVELNHGYIKASSIPNQETCFSFVLPIDRESFFENEIIYEPISVINRTVVRVPKDSNSKEKEPVYTEQSEERAEVLIVEDNYELRNFLAEELNEKYIVYQAEDEKPGIEIAFEKIPDLVVSDIVMPDGNGIKLCNVLKADIRTCHIPVILLTAKTAISDQIEGIETGADAYITKPFNMQFLLAQINQLIRSRRELCAHFSQDVYITPNKMTSNQIDQKLLQQTIDYILANIGESSLNVEGLAEHLGLSRSNIYRKIKALTGKTAIEFIRIVRLKQAVKLMETNQYSLAEIAYLTGFTSPSYFTQSFKDQYGKPPSEYLKG